jgi:hypothetical protein
VMRDVVRLKWSRMRVRFFSDANTSVVNPELTKRLSKSYSTESPLVSWMLIELEKVSNMLIAPASRGTYFTGHGKWYFGGNAHALNEPNLRKNSKTTNPKISLLNSQKRKSKPKIYKIRKKMSKNRAEPARRNRTKKHKTTQNSPKPLLSPTSARSLYGELFDFGLGREFLSAVAAASATLALSSRAISTRRRASPCGGFKYSRTTLSPL